MNASRRLEASAFECSQFLGPLRRALRIASTSVTLAMIAQLAEAQSEVGEVPRFVQSAGPMPVSAAAPECISAVERANVSRRIRAWRASTGNAPSGNSLFAAQTYSFFPMGGRLYRDVFPYNFVDLDPGAGVLDWDCGDRTVDGHLGVDTLLRSFEEQLLGVPVFSALDGTVVATNDGYPDMNTTCTALPANYVVVDHRAGRLGYYWHLRNGSVAVATGQVVRAGEQLGFVGSSGCSIYPHLHFEEQLSGNVVEPHTGPCNPGASGWTQQTPISYGLYLDDFGVSDTVPSSIGSGGYIARSGQWPQTSSSIFIWSFWKNFPAMSTSRVVFIRPNGTTGYDSGTQDLGNTNGGRWWWSYWGFWPPPVQSTPGTWKIRVSINGVQYIEAALEVVPTLIPGFNRAPEPISVRFASAYPTPSDVVVCEVDTDLALDDLDFDVLRYHYVWRVDGVDVRDVTTAAHSDVLPRDSWASGAVLSCDVTPNDGLVDGATATASSFISRAFCTSATTTNGCVPKIQGIGTPSVTSSSSFTVNVSSVEGQKQGIFFYGVDNTGFTPLAWGSSTSYLCVKAPTQRSSALNSGGAAGACDGSLDFDWSAFIAANPNALGAPFSLGEHVFVQAWFRDPPSPKTTALSNALEFMLGP